MGLARALRRFIDSLVGGTKDLSPQALRLHRLYLVLVVIVKLKYLLFSLPSITLASFALTLSPSLLFIFFAIV